MGRRPRDQIEHGSSSRQRSWQTLIWILGTICLSGITYTFHYSSRKTRNFPRPGVENLGKEVEGRYHLLGTRMDSYIRTIADFTATAFPLESSSDIIRSLPKYLVHFDHQRSYKPATTAFPKIHRINRHNSSTSKSGLRSDWTMMVKDEGWDHISWDDRAIFQWFEGLYKGNRTGNTGLNQVWKLLETSEMRTVLFKYLAVLLEGGMYIDDKTYPVRPISQRGEARPEIYDISSTDKTRWRRVVERTDPSVVLLIDVDVHKVSDWNQTSESRPLEISARVFSAAPHHPIFIDAVRRIVQLVRDPSVQKRLIPSIDASEGGLALSAEERDMGSFSEDGYHEDRSGILSSLLTESGILTDSALSYLLARYSVGWHDLRGIDRPLRIGEVLVLPTTAIIRGDFLQGDFDSDDRQTVVAYGRE